MLNQIISNRYRIDKELGSGGMATVYLATDLNTSAKVAVKFLHPQYAKDFSYIERFNREAATSIELAHPNIVKTLDYGAQKTEHFIVMEYIEGKTLAQALLKNGTFPEEAALSIARSVVKAIAYASSRGIVHRDIKPQNIMLADGERVKVADFGIAKVATGHSMTQTGLIIGSPNYISPEQIKGETVDARSDIYAVGIVLYELLEGHAPFEADTPWPVINMHITQEPPLADVHIAEDIKSLIEKCLKKDPAERYQTPAEMITDIDRLLAARNHQTTSNNYNPSTAKTVLQSPTAYAQEHAPPPAGVVDPHAPTTVLPVPNNDKTRLMTPEQNPTKTGQPKGTKNISYKTIGVGTALVIIALIAVLYQQNQLFKALINDRKALTTAPSLSDTNPSAQTQAESQSSTSDLSIKPNELQTPRPPETQRTPAINDTLLDFEGALLGPCWIVVVASLSPAEGYSEFDAQSYADEMIADGWMARTLFSSDYSSLNPGYWVVYSDEFADKSSAMSHARDLQEAGYTGAYQRWLEQ